MSNDRLAEIKERWDIIRKSGDPWQAYNAAKDVGWLIAKVERLRHVADAARLVCMWASTERLDALRDALRALDAVECKEEINDGQPTAGRVADPHWDE